MIELGKCPVGSTVKYDSQGQTETATVCGHKNAHTLLGWSAPSIIFASWRKDHQDKFTQYLMPDPIKFGYWVPTDMTVELINQTVVQGQSTPPSVGMKCAGKFCGDFYHYAVPNQSDGKTFYCYSCRNKPACMR